MNIENCSEELGELFTALAKAQMEMDNAIKDSSNPFFKSKYAGLASVISASRPSLSKNGLSVIHVIKDYAESGKRFVFAILGHSSGQRISFGMELLFQKQDMQSYGSAITYARRYTYMMVTGIATEDDDGESAVGRGGQAVTTPEIKKASPKADNSSKPAEVKKDDSAIRPDEIIEDSSRVINAEEGRKLLSLAVNNGYTKDDVLSFAKTLGYDRLVDIMVMDYDIFVETFSQKKGAPADE